MTPAWWNARSPASPRRAAASNIPNAKTTHRPLPLLAAESFENTGESLQTHGRFLAARRAYLSALKLYRRANERYGVAHMHLKCGDVSRQIEDFSSALQHYRQAQKVSALALDARCGEALALRGQGHYRRALAQLLKCGLAYRAAGDREGRAYVLWAMGTTLRFWGRLDNAEVRLRQSLRWYDRLPDPVARAYARCGLGGTLRMRGMAEESGRLYRAASKIFARHRDDFGLAYATCGQGSAQRMMGRHGDALSFMRQAERRYRALQQKGPLAFVLWGRAQSEIALDKFSAAKRDLREAEKLFRRVRDARGLIYIQLGWGEFFRAQGSSRARAFYRRATASASRAGLLLERAHAARRLAAKSSWKAYRATGIRQKYFARYKTLP